MASTAESKSFRWLFNDNSFSIGTLQGVPGGSFNILGGDNIGRVKQKSLYVHVCYSERFPRQSYISLYKRATRHVLTRVAKCIDVDGGIFENVFTR
jgi:hypothetical protein